MMNQSVCRCCLRENAPITYKIFDDGANLWEGLKFCLPTSLRFEYNDGLPQIICDLCWHLVQQFTDFQRRCVQADQELKSRYTDYKNQAVEEVLSLIEQLRQQDNNNTSDYIRHNNNKELPEFINIDSFENVQFNGDFDICNASPDSGIFEDDFYPHNLNNFENFFKLEADQTNSSELSSNSSRSSEYEATAKRRSYKGPFPCNHCDKKFTRNFQLKLHLISVHQIGDGLQYTCHICSKTFASNHSLSYHQKSIHYQQKPHFCPQCDKQFVLKSQLASHMRTHTGETKPRILECVMCGKKWPTKSDLRTHMRSHDPNMERPFKCDRCEKSFFTRGHLTSHQLVHTGEKPFPCEFCNRSYQSVGNLNNHMTRRHIKEMVHRDQNPVGIYGMDTERTQPELVLMEA